MCDDIAWGERKLYREGLVKWSMAEIQRSQTVKIHFVMRSSGQAAKMMVKTFLTPVAAVTTVPSLVGKPLKFSPALINSRDQTGKWRV